MLVKDTKANRDKCVCPSRPSYLGKDDVNKLDAEDLVSLEKDLSEITGVKWVDEK
jgi:hypothetical protein